MNQVLIINWYSILNLPLYNLGSLVMNLGIFGNNPFVGLSNPATFGVRPNRNEFRHQPPNIPKERKILLKTRRG